MRASSSYDRRTQSAAGSQRCVLEISPAARLVAVDWDPGRLVNVSSTLERLGLEARIMTGDAADPSTFWDGHLFDRVLVDAARGPGLSAAIPISRSCAGLRTSRAWPRSSPAC